MKGASHFLAIKTPRVRDGERIGLMGGSFNPPHEGHLAVAETALRRGALDSLWWIVTPGNPLKTHSELAPLEARISACEALARDPRMAVTAFEADLGCSYTHETVTFLKTRYPAARFVWVMGGDSLANFHRWRSWRSIAESLPLLVIDRPNWRLKALSSPAARAMARSQLPSDRAEALADLPAPAWAYLTNPLSPLSSTDLRGKAR